MPEGAASASRAQLADVRRERAAAFRRSGAAPGAAPAAPRAPPSAQCVSESESARSMLAETNAFRAGEGLGALEWNPRLAGIAERSAARMACCELPFSHDGADERFAEYPLRPGPDTYGENLARSEGIRPMAGPVVRGWVGSPGHRRNLLGPFTACGIGAATNASGVTFVVQLLASLPPGDGANGNGAAPAATAPRLAQGGPGASQRALLLLFAVVFLLLHKGGWLGA